MGLNQNSKVEMSPIYRCLTFLIALSFVACSPADIKHALDISSTSDDPSVAPASVNSLESYSSSRQINDFWAGEYPSGLMVLEAGVVLRARSAIDPNLPKSINCPLEHRGFYHPWNEGLVEKQNLKFKSATEIQNYKVMEPVSVEISIETSNGEFEDAHAEFEIGDTVKYLGYTGEGYGLIEVDGRPAHVDLESVLRSTDRNPDAFLPADDLWIEMSCGAETGFVLINELEDRTDVEMGMDGIQDYGKASNLTADASRDQKTESGVSDTQLEYVCYKNDDNPNMVIWISYGGGKAQQIKFNQGSSPMNLSFIETSMSNEGAYPTTRSLYKEVYKGRENGTYLLTHSGVWDYAKYTRKSDGKVYNFTIDHNFTPYSNAPCF